MNNLVSVIIPTYKRNKFISRAIDSILAQSYENIEIIVVDDNGDDTEYGIKTERKLNEYILKGKIIYLKNKKNLGGALARNEGIKIAQGEFVTFLDDDDLYLKNKIKNQVKFMLENKFDFTFTDVRMLNEKDKSIDYRTHEYVKSTDNAELLKYHIMHHLTPTDTYMIRTDKLKEIGCFENHPMGQEFHLMLKAIKIGLNIGYLPLCEVIQYIHSGERISVGMGKIQAEMKLFEFKKKYFDVLNRKQRKYVVFRHYSVLAFVNIRGYDYVQALKFSIRAFLSSPVYFLDELRKYPKRKAYLESGVN